MVLYNVIMSIASRYIKDQAEPKEGEEPKKLNLLGKGQKEVWGKIDRELTYNVDKRPIVWLHASSMGEYAIARPLIQRLRAKGYRIVMTFFSPTGVEHVGKMRNNGIDYLYYLPLDTKRNVKQLLDKVRPSMALFMVSEYWYNYLTELKRRGIPTYLVSAKVDEKSIFSRPWGFMHRRCLKCYTHIFVHDEESRDNLLKAGAENVSVTGNPLHENAFVKAKATRGVKEVEGMIDKGKPLFIAGSVHTGKDMKLIAELCKRHPEMQFLVVPHEPNDDTWSSMQWHFGSIPNEQIARYTWLSREAMHIKPRVIYFDKVGELSELYGYGTMAYVGGGFTKRLLHNLLEPTIYGLPVAFGPNTQRKLTPQHLIDLGIGQKVNNADDLDEWVSGLLAEPERLSEIKKTAKEYFERNLKGADAIINIICKE